MDETLAELYSVYYFVASLKVSEILREEGDKISPPLEKQLKKDYKQFVKKILLKEISLTPLGILRPGILNIMKQLHELQKTGKVAYVVIYSNNGHLQSLEFIKDLIHTYLGTNDLIRDCIHWNHFMRLEETKSLDQPTKTWNILKNILVMSHCQAPHNLHQKDVYFFDDLDHIDLQKNLGTNYYKVPAYNFKTSFDRIAEIYKKSLENVDLNEYIRLISDEFSIKHANSLDTIIEEFKKRTGPTDDLLPPGPDSGIDMILKAIVKVSSLTGTKTKHQKITKPLISGGNRQRSKTKKRKAINHGQKKLKSVSNQ